MSYAEALREELVKLLDDLSTQQTVLNAALVTLKGQEQHLNTDGKAALREALAAGDKTIALTRDILNKI